MNYFDAAGRSAYLAGFHAAQALIFERTGRSVKTHGGVHTEFHRLLRDDARMSVELRPFLSVAYKFKTIADYDTGPGAEVSPEMATAAIATAGRFVSVVAGIIEEDTAPGAPVA